MPNLRDWYWSLNVCLRILSCIWVTPGPTEKKSVMIDSNGCQGPEDRGVAKCCISVNPGLRNVREYHKGAAQRQREQMHGRESSHSSQFCSALPKLHTCSEKAHMAPSGWPGLWGKFAWTFKTFFFMGRLYSCYQNNSLRTLLHEKKYWRKVKQLSFYEKSVWYV